MGNSHPNTPQSETKGIVIKQQGGLALGSSSGKKAAPKREKNHPSSSGASSSHSNKKPTTTTTTAVAAAAAATTTTTLLTAAQRTTTTKRQPPSSSNSSTHDKSSNESSSSSRRQQQTLLSAGRQQAGRTNERSRQDELTRLTAADEVRRGQRRPAASPTAIAAESSLNQLPPLLGPKVSAAKAATATTTNDEADEARKDTRHERRPLPPLLLDECDDEPPTKSLPPDETATTTAAIATSNKTPGKQQQQQPSRQMPKPKANLNRSSSLYVTSKNMTYEPASSQLITLVPASIQASAPSASPTRQQQQFAGAGRAPVGGALLMYSMGDGNPMPFQQRFVLPEDQSQRVRHWINTQPFYQVERWNKSEPGDRMESSDTTSDQSELAQAGKSSSRASSKMSALVEEDPAANQQQQQHDQRKPFGPEASANLTEDGEDLIERSPFAAAASGSSFAVRGPEDENGNSREPPPNKMGQRTASPSSAREQQRQQRQQQHQQEHAAEMETRDENGSEAAVHQVAGAGEDAAAQAGQRQRPRSSSMQIISRSVRDKIIGADARPKAGPSYDDCSLCQYLESIQATVVDKRELVSATSGGVRKSADAATAAAAAATAIGAADDKQPSLATSLPAGQLRRRQDTAKLQIGRQLNWQSSTATSATVESLDEFFNWRPSGGGAHQPKAPDEDQDLNSGEEPLVSASETVTGARAVSGGSSSSSVAEAANYQSGPTADEPLASSCTDSNQQASAAAASETSHGGDKLATKTANIWTENSGELPEIKQRREMTQTNDPNRRRLKVMRGYSLDTRADLGRPTNSNTTTTNNNNSSSSNNNSRVSYYRASMKSNGEPAAMKRTCSKPNLGQAFRGKSQSKRLIVINSEEASYTIQVATTESSGCIAGTSSNSNPVSEGCCDRLAEQTTNSRANYNHQQATTNKQAINNQQQQQQRPVAKYILRKQRVDKFQSQRAHLTSQSFDERGCSDRSVAATAVAGVVFSSPIFAATQQNNTQSQPYSNTKGLSTSLNLAKAYAHRQTDETYTIPPGQVEEGRRNTLNHQPLLQAMMHERPAPAGMSNKSDETSTHEYLSSSQADPKKAQSIDDRSSSSEQISKKEPISDPETDHRSLMDMVTLNFQAAAHYNDETARSCNIAAKRLRDLADHLEHGSVPQSVLYQTLEYAAAVLDTVTMDQISRVSDEEEGDLSEVQSDAVPNEVRKWLETTFTRNSISQKRKSEDKLKFRSVANAIRAGIVVDRIYRRTSASIPFVSAEVSGLLKSIDDWSFDCFAVNQVSAGQVLKSVGYELFNRYGLIYKFKIPTTILKNFLTQIELGYTKNKNPYHNNLHAADVTQTVHYMLWQAGLTNWLTDLEIFATLLAAIIHDYLHTGTTNNFHVMSQSETALLYNDRAVLENFHICQAFTLMRNEDCNILAGLSKDEYREFRSLVIDMVLATDMSSHFQQIKAMKNILNHSDNFNADKSKILSLVIHISDISHPAKEWELHSQWTQLLMEEFFRQGDREKELDLECSPLCDRETTLVAESQLGFIEFIVSPSLEICGDVLDRVHYQMAEANARPVMPASAKAASVVAASSSSINKQQQQKESSKPAAIEPPPQPELAKSANSNSSRASSGGSGSGIASLASNSSANSAAAGGPCSSFVSSETLTSNLRKMIVSSSATIGRKLNISGSSSSSSSSPAAAAPAIVPPAPSQLATANQAQPSSTRVSLAATDFETRQANYKHPVIQQEGSMRPKSSDPRGRQEQSSSDTAAQQQDNRRVSAATDRSADLTVANRSNQASIEQVANRGASSASASHQQTQLFKIKRPWIACLDRNKKIWNERSITDAQARELKERMKRQQQIQEAPSELEQ